MSGVHVNFNGDEVEMLRLAKKRRRISCRDYDWWDLLALMRKGGISRVDSDRGAGWPHFVLAPRGKRYLKRLNLRRQQQNQMRR